MNIEQKPNRVEEDRITNIINAELIGRRSHCASKKVGCIVVREKRIISSGCNGTPSGTVNCDDIFDASRMDEPDYRALHHAFSEDLECHAEENAIINAVRNGIAILPDSAFYVSLKPCTRCLKMIASLGVKRIYYLRDYDMHKNYSDNVKRMMLDLGIVMRQIPESEMIRMLSELTSSLNATIGSREDA